MFLVQLSTINNFGSVLKFVNRRLNSKYKAKYTPFGVRTITKNELGYNFPRGFTMHEHLDEFGIINANARLYDPYLARFVSPDPLIQDVTNSQNFNRYSYCLNNPLKYTDPTGEFVWWPVIAMSSAFAVGNVTTHLASGDVKNFGQGVKMFAQGAIVGATLGAVGQIPIVNKVLGGMWKYNKWGLAAMGAATIGSSFAGAVSGNKPDVLTNTLKIVSGIFSLDDSNFFRGIWQGVSRFSWEALQTNVGLCYALGCNVGWRVDYVNYLGGATYSVNEYAKKNDGITMGNYIGIKIEDEVSSNFGDYVRKSHHGLFMHEYGHTIQGRRYGLAYLFAIGMPSLKSAKYSHNVSFGSTTIKSHRLSWFEREASAYARDYFGSDWSNIIDIETKYHPTYGF